MRSGRFVSALSTILLCLVLVTPTSAQETNEETGQIGTPAPVKPDVVGAGGEFTHRISISIPEFRDLPLPVSLGYNSSDISRAGVNKIVAFGWSLGGFSMIERKSLGGGVPTFDDGQDIYVLDGQELMACAGATATNPWARKYPLRYLTDRSNASCSAGGNLTARVEDFNRIVLDPATNRFTVTRPDGTRLVYASVSALAGDASTTGTPERKYATTGRWLLTRIEDAQDTRNTVTYTYAFAPKADGYAHRPVRIDYAGYSVQFAYRTFPTNAVAKFATGTSLMGRQAYQLRSIQIFDEAKPIRAYQLTHTASALTGTQLLASVREYGSDFVAIGPDITGGTALPAVEMGYSADTVSFEMKSYQGKEFHEAVIVDDTNFDGTDELIFTAESLILKQNNDNQTLKSYYGFMPGHYSFDRQRQILNRSKVTRGCWPYVGPNSVTLSYTKEVRRWQDSTAVAGNRRIASPLVCFKHNYRHYETGTSDNSTTDYRLLTVNMSTLTEIASIGTRKLDAHVSYPLSIIGNFDLDPETEIIMGGGIFDVVDGIISAGSIPGGTWGNPSGSTVGRYSADFSGDGVQDVIKSSFLRVTPEPGYLAGALIARAGYLNFSIPTANKPPTLPPSHNRFISGGVDFIGYGDLDGNGLNDIVTQTSNGSLSDSIFIYPSTGNGLGNPIKIILPNLLAFNRGYFGVTSSSPRTVFHRSSISDLNSDGLMDLIVHDGFPSPSATNAGPPYTSGKSWIFVNTGDDFVQVKINGSLSGFSRLIASGDFDGDGLTDVALEGTANTQTTSWPIVYVRQDGRILFGNGGIPNRLISIKSEAGAATTISYAPSSDFGTNQMPGVQQVVKSITTNDGRGNSSTVEYRYVGGRYDFIARQTLGYKTVTAYLPAVAGETEGPQVVTTYLNDHLAEYGLVKSRIMIQGGITLSREIFDYAIQKSGKGPWRADRTSERRATLSGTTLVETMVTRAYDVFGQLIRETNIGFTQDGTNLDPGDDVTVTIGFLPNLTAYIVDRPSFRREEAGLAATAQLTDDLAFIAMSYDGAAAAVAPTNGNLTKVEEWTGNTAALTLRTARILTYDAWGNVLSETDAKSAAANLGPAVIYTYDTAKNLFRLSTANALGHVETIAWDTLCQKPAQVSDQNARVTSTAFDPLCRETRTDLPNGQYRVTRYVGFGTPTAQYIERETKSGSTFPGRDLSITREYFDGLGRHWATTTSGATSAITDAILMLRAYDARTNLAWTSIPLSWAAFGTTPNPTQRTSFTYDGLDRLVDTAFPDGARRRQTYFVGTFSHYGSPTLAHPGIQTQDEHCFDAADASTLCGTVRQFLDAFGRLIRTDRIDTGLSDVDAGEETRRSTSYRFDLKGSLIAVTDPGGISFAYTYDIYGNRLSADDPGLGVWTLTYDANNNLLSQTDAKGQLISFVYDRLNRVMLKTVGTGATRVETRFTYDEPRAGEFNIGRETTQMVWNPAQGVIHRVTRGWHVMGGLAVERHTIDGRTYALETSFAPNARHSTKSSPAHPAPPPPAGPARFPMMPRGGSQALAAMSAPSVTTSGPSRPRSPMAMA